MYDDRPVGSCRDSAPDTAPRPRETVGPNATPAAPSPSTPSTTRRPTGRAGVFRRRHVHLTTIYARGGLLVLSRQPPLLSGWPGGTLCRVRFAVFGGNF